MERWKTHTLLPAVLATLGRPEDDPAVRRLAEDFGGAPAVRDQEVGEPVRHVRRLLFSSGGEIVLHDGAVAAVLLGFAPAPDASRGLDLAEWISGVTNEATLDELASALGLKVHFSGMSSPYFELDGGYARLSFKDGRGWNEPGRLMRVTVTAAKPGLACHPEDDDCPSCSGLLVRNSAGVDVDATVTALQAALEAGVLTEDARWVKLADLRPIHASGLMERAESQLTCRECRRIMCFTLYRDAPPTFGYYVLNDAMRRPMDLIPPVEQWADAERLARERDAMHYLDHRPGGWFLVGQRDELYLDARYSYSAVIDDSALIRLDESERKAYDDGGHGYLSELAERIHNSGPYQKESPYYARDLYRGADGKKYRSMVAAAIVNHTWLAEQRRKAAE
ncbi:hypothetical protein BIU82_02605 [Arthrobacter sp. SW1]|uniref:hypothetical protein n=1 Tax=Arthrobacter sp. SW1 TaxID=1920889 RepID=UPI000877C666|nr:hypothetical protein [Arthrobacter sp. SW1]OFI39949.1 hypothetical protein BIU82_02605 [Arthrobacter sp. SW1]